MAAEFRCEHCGKLMRSEVQPGRKVRCELCHRKTEVPAGLAGLPRPLVPSDPLWTGPIHEPPVAPGLPSEAGPQREALLARCMPWVMSLFLHAGLGLILVFFSIVVFTRQGDSLAKAPPSVVLTDLPTEPFEFGQDGDVDNPTQPLPTEQMGTSHYEGPILLDTGRLDTTADTLIGLAASGATGGPQLAPTGPPRWKHKPKLFPPVPGVRANHVVFVIDCSGSMVDTFDPVRYEMLKSISYLQEDQNFHVILFSSGPPIENPPRRLVPATKDYKEAAAEFLSKVRPVGQTDPIPALKRAFEVLARADDRPKLVYLLTDAAFPDNQAVLDFVRRANAGRGVRVFTYLYGRQPDATAGVMKTIAAESGGRYKYVSPDE